MRASIIKIGNSRGIRIPKPVFEQCGFQDEVELEIEDQTLVIRSGSKARENWEEAFQSMANQLDDTLDPELEDLPNRWDETDWEWK
jgi:antitoxin MazE